VRFAEYLERVLSKTSKALEAAGIRSLPQDLQLLGSTQVLRDLLERAHIFNLGDGDDLDRAAQDIFPDLVEECRDDIPAPFDNMLVLCDLGARGWSCEWHIKAGPYLSPHVADMPQLQRVRFLIDLSEPILDLPPLSVMAAYTLAPAGDRLAVVLTPDTIRRGARRFSQSEATIGPELAQDVFRAILKVAIISHPANYVVRTSPKLTPHEERRRASKGIFPLQKKPHYIVIDHETLVDLSPRESAGTHRPPTPHARRGHWRRLADRCLHAKASGKQRIWVGETYVGATEFEDERNRYEVVLNRVALEKESHQPLCEPNERHPV
jgi:hypothetical protein